MKWESIHEQHIYKLSVDTWQTICRCDVHRWIICCFSLLTTSTFLLLIQYFVPRVVSQALTSRTFSDCTQLFSGWNWNWWSLRHDNVTTSTGIPQKFKLIFTCTSSSLFCRIGDHHHHHHSSSCRNVSVKYKNDKRMILQRSFRNFWIFYCISNVSERIMMLQLTLTRIKNTWNSSSCKVDDDTAIQRM